MLVKDSDFISDGVDKALFSWETIESSNAGNVKAITLEDTTQDFFFNSKVP